MISRPDVHPDAPETPCRRCGYDLRGTGPVSCCPECGAPSYVAFEGDALHFFDPQWLGSMFLGTEIVMSGFWFGLMVLGPIAVVLQFVTDLPAAGLLYILPLLALLAGGWVFASPNPMYRDREPLLSWRRLVRVCLCAVPLTIVLLVFPNPLIRPMWVLLLGAPTGLFGLLGGIALSRYVGFIADCVGDELSIHHARVYRKTFVWGWIGVTIPSAVYTITGSSGLIMLLLLPGVAFMLGGGLLVLLLPLFVTDRLYETYKHACEYWAEPLPSEHRIDRPIVEPPEFIACLFECLLEGLCEIVLSGVDALFPSKPSRAERLRVLRARRRNRAIRRWLKKGRGGGGIPKLGLRCRQCDYNLAGLIERTCPECGRNIDIRYFIDTSADRKPRRKKSTPG